MYGSNKKRPERHGLEVADKEQKKGMTEIIPHW